MKHKIEKNTVQETLIIPLYARKVCSELYPNLYQDETAVRLIDEIDYDFSESEKKSRSLMQRFGSLEVAMRQNDLAWEVRDYLKTHPNAAVVNLGCGLDSTGRSCDNGSCKIYNLDFPDVIAVRNELLPAGEREENKLSELHTQMETAKAEVSKPFPREEELKTKLARLEELNALLNMDKHESEVIGDTEMPEEQPPARKTTELER